LPEAHLLERPPNRPAPHSIARRRVSVVIPARNEARSIARTVAIVLDQAPRGVELEVLVVDDGSRDETAARARAAGARVLLLGPHGLGGSPGAARNRGFAVATGDPVVFLDADCLPTPGWLQALLAAHDAGETVVGGALALPADAAALPWTARFDHYCGCYHVQPERPAGYVPNHTPANLSVRREAFASTGGFAERPPVADGHEELAWQAELARRGLRIWFEPRAAARHHGRPGFGNLLARNYRWGYSALESKAETGASRWPGLFRHPLLLILASPFLAPAHTLHTLACWLRLGIREPLLLFPALAAARLAYAAGLSVGGLRWLARRRTGKPGERPRWR
jgi:glycosyltransferase involved in cell wall biosynthesis